MLGTKIHVAVDGTGLPISIVIGSANIHDSAKFINVLEDISDFVDDSMIKEVVKVYADKGYDSTSIRDYLKSRNIIPCIPFRRNSKSPEIKSYKKYNSIRYTLWRDSLVEEWFS